MEQSKLALIKVVHEIFKTKLCALKNNKTVSKNNKVLNLNPFIDAYRILRVGAKSLTSSAGPE